MHSRRMGKPYSSPALVFERIPAHTISLRSWSFQQGLKALTCSNARCSRTDSKFLR